MLTAQKNLQRKEKETNPKKKIEPPSAESPVFFFPPFFGSAKIERWWCHWRIALPKRTKDLVPLWRNLTWWCAGCAVRCSITRCRKWWGSLNSGNLHLSLLDNSKGGKINIYFHTNKQKKQRKEIDIYIYIYIDCYGYIPPQKKISAFQTLTPFNVSILFKKYRFFMACSVSTSRMWFINFQSADFDAPAEN